MSNQPAARDEPTTPAPSAEIDKWANKIPKNALDLSNELLSLIGFDEEYYNADVAQSFATSITTFAAARVAEAVERERAGCGNLIHASISDHDSSDVKQALIWCVAAIRERKP